MKTVILGADSLGQYVASSLIQDTHSVTLVDADAAKLKSAASHMDVSVKQAHGLDATLLKELLEENPKLFIALTNSDELNVTACAVAKSLGYPRTLACLQDPRYLRHDPVNFNTLFSIDHLVVPDMLVASRLAKAAANEGHYNESFFHGEALLRTITLPKNWKGSGKSLAELCPANRRLTVGLIRRNGVCIFPHGQDLLYSDDEVTLIGDAYLPEEMRLILGIDAMLPSSAWILGASPIGRHLARQLHKKGIQVRLVDTSKETCYSLAQELPFVSILHSQGADWDFLKREQIDRADCCIACTTSDQKNLQLALFARELGCPKVLSVFSDESTSHIAQNLSILTVTSRLAISDYITAVVRQEKLTAMLSLHDREAEVMAVKISKGSPLIGIPLSQLAGKFPHEFIVGLIYKQGRVLPATGMHALSHHDEVLIVSHAKHRQLLEKLF